MGGQAQGTGNHIANGNEAVNVAVNGPASALTSNTQYCVANGSSQPMPNGFPQGIAIASNGDPQGLGSSGIANRLPHGAQLYVSLQSSSKSYEKCFNVLIANFGKL